MTPTHYDSLDSSDFMVKKCVTPLQGKRQGTHSPIMAVLIAVVVSLWALQVNAYGAAANSAYPIWSDLSYFERSTIGDLYKARKNDPEALLALYLLASGERNLSSFDTANKSVKAFVRQTQKRIIEEDNQALTGAILNTEMHQYFFAKNKKEGTFKGYDSAQSRLMGIFENGSFNCISSTLLYIVLAAHFDLDVEGVLLPSHAFAQLNLRGKQSIDIETTSASGFDQKHDEDFYKRQNSNWFSDRGLEPATYQNYLDRDIVSPTLLAAKNMLNQHTGLGLMDLGDSGRLAEISAYMNPQNLLANEKRLYFYGTTINTLIDEQDWDSLIRFYRITYEYVLHDSAYFPEEKNLQSNLRLYLSGAILAYAQAGDSEQTLKVMGELLARGLTSPEHQLEIERRVENAVKVLLNTLVKQNRFEDGLLVLSLIEGHLSNAQAWPEMLTWLYLNWAKQFWDLKNWQGAIDVLNDYMAYPNLDASRGEITKSLQDAYTNLVIQAIQNKDVNTAQIAMEQCMSTVYNSVCANANKVLTQAQKQAD